MTNPKLLNPAASIIDKMGGVDAVADIVDRHPNTVRRWQFPRDDKNNGTGGVIPAGYIPKLVVAASDMGVSVTYADFFPQAESA